MTAAIAATGCEVLRLSGPPVDGERARADTKSVRALCTSGCQHGFRMMLVGSVALKGCAARTGKPASALDRDTADKCVAMIPLWRSG